MAGTASLRESRLNSSPRYKEHGGDRASPLKERLMAKVLIADELSPRATEIFRARGLEVDVRHRLSADELKAGIGAYDGLAVRSTTKVTEELIARADRLKVIGRAGI